jgi:hypothetical protein
MKYFIALMLVAMIGCSSEVPQTTEEVVPVDTTVVSTPTVEAVEADTTTVPMPE